MQRLLDLFLELDVQLQSVVEEYGAWSYAILFVVIFAETGLVITPFLPGDSLIFAAAALGVTGVIDPLLLFALLSAAAILGDSVNYSVGAAIGPRAFREGRRFLKRAYLLKTERFYAEHGGKTIVIARFLPVVRTYAPFVAGVSRMTYRRFLAYNVGGGVFWVGLYTVLGYFFGSTPLVRDHFSLVILVIIGLSVVPPMYHWMRRRRHRRPPSGDLRTDRSPRAASGNEPGVSVARARRRRRWLPKR